MRHRCHATGCEIEIAPRLFMCRRHWFALPRPLRDAVWKTYRAGQESDKLPGAAYIEAARAAIKWHEEREGRAGTTGELI